MSRNFNEELPFGKIKDKDVVENPYDPLIYAEVRIGEGKFSWEGPEYPASRHSDGSELFELTTKKDGDLESIAIDRDQARIIFRFLTDGFWHYAE